MRRQTRELHNHRSDTGPRPRAGLREPDSMASGIGVFDVLRVGTAEVERQLS